MWETISKVVWRDPSYPAAKHSTLKQSWGVYKFLCVQRFVTLWNLNILLLLIGSVLILSVTTMVVAKRNNTVLLPLWWCVSVKRKSMKVKKIIIIKNNSKNNSIWGKMDFGALRLAAGQGLETLQYKWDLQNSSWKTNKSDLTSETWSVQVFKCCWFSF